jgi:hypothetical protein
VRMGMVASAEAPAAKRKKLRRERPLQAGSMMGEFIAGKTPWDKNGSGGKGLTRVNSRIGEEENRREMSSHI